MKGLIFYFLILTNFAIAKVEFASYYFVPGSVELADSSTENVRHLKKSMEIHDIQLIEINLFTKHSLHRSESSDLNKKRLQFILDLFNTQADIVSISIIGERSNGADHNWSNRIDIYYSQQPSSANFADGSQAVEANRFSATKIIVDPRTLICAKPYREPDLNYIVKGVPIFIPIEFEGNTSKILEGHENVLLTLRDKLNGNMQLTAHIRGHVCCGDRMRLSRRRAKKVYEFLIKQGIDSARLSYKGYSNTVLLVPHEETDADRKMNRRVDVIFN